MIAACNFFYGVRMDEVRRTILEAAEARGMTLADLSKRIGRNHAYMQQFIRRHIPDILSEKTARAVAVALDIPPSELGVLAGESSVDARDMVRVPEHDVRASAGPGAIIDGETQIEVWPLPRRYIRDALSLRSGNLAIIEVIGDSMEPTLRSGDKIMIDLDDKNVSMPGVFALYDGDATVVKRVERIPAADLVRIKSDNPHHSQYDVPIDLISVAGRVVWFGRRL